MVGRKAPRVPGVLTVDPRVRVVRKAPAAPTDLRDRGDPVVPARLALAVRHRRTIASSGSSLAVA